MDITQEYLRDSAVEAVKAYVINKKPLTDTVTEISLRDNLRPEQVKRVVEVVNQVAYIKLLESAKDRTFEFPLASYDDIMAKILSPEEILEENVKPSPLSVMRNSVAETLNKEASEEEDDPLAIMPEQQKEAMLFSEYNRTKAMIEKLAHEEREMLEQILDRAERCKEDPEFLEKVAYFLEDDEDTIKKISKLVYGQVKKASGEELFYEEDLTEAKKVVSLLKEAEELVEKRKGLEKSAQKVENYFVDKAKRVKAGVKDVVTSLKPSRLDVAFTAASFKSDDPIWSSLHKRPGE